MQPSHYVGRAAQPPEGPMPTPLHVLILEASPSDVELMLHELRRAGFEPRWQHVATEPDFLARLAPPPDIILTDYTLPQFDALRALRCVQERAPELHAGGPGRAALPCGHEGGVLSGAEVEGGGEQ